MEEGGGRSVSQKSCDDGSRGCNDVTAVFADVTNYHTLSGLKNMNLLSYHCGGQKSLKWVSVS